MIFVASEGGLKKTEFSMSTLNKLIGFTLPDLIVGGGGGGGITPNFGKKYHPFPFINTPPN